MSKIYRYILAKKVVKFYRTSMLQPKTPKVYAVSLCYEHKLMTYLEAIHDELDIYDYKTIDPKGYARLQKLYGQLQALLDYAI